MMSTRKLFSTLGALLRHYGVNKYWEKNGQVAIYRFYRFRWYAPHPDGGYMATGRVTGDVAGCECIELKKQKTKP